MLRNIPVNIITGFLGVGKTTAIRHLLDNKPEDEKWAVLVNEFGQMGIDQAAFGDNQQVVIKELPGGCICCTLGLPLTMSLVMLLQRHKPDRLLIEPTGIGHPTGILDTLASEPFAEALDIRATICLVDPRALDDPQTLGNEIFQDQINIADVLVINKTDLAEADQVASLKARAEGMFPPKHAVTETRQGQIDLQLLDAVSSKRSASHPQAHQQPAAPHPHDHAHPAVDQGQAPAEEQPAPGQPLLKTGQGYGHYSYSWRFHPDHRFDQDRLALWCHRHKEIQRIKGAIRTGQQWILLNQVRGEQVVSPLAWRRDSRIELISDTPLDAERIQADLLGCLQPPQ